MTEMGKRLRQARLDAGYTSASAAARALGLTGSTYIAHENGQNEFSAEQAQQYAKAFKTTTDWLLFGTLPSPVSIDSQLRELPPDDAQRLIAEFAAMIRATKLIRGKN